MNRIRKRKVNTPEKPHNFIMLPTVDFCFKELMQNPKVRQGIISAILNVPPDRIQYTKLMPTILQKEHQDDKCDRYVCFVFFHDYIFEKIL